SQDRCADYITAPLFEIVSAAARSAVGRRSEPLRVAGLAPDRRTASCTCGRLRQDHLQVTDVAYREPRFAARQVELPHANDAVVDSELAHFRQTAHEALAPVAKRLHIVLADLLHPFDAQVGMQLQGAGDPVQRGQQATGEDVLLDPIELASVAIEALVWNRDGLQEHESARLQQTRTSGEEGRIVLVTDGLEHLDGHNAIEAASDLAIIAQVHVDGGRQTRRLDPLPR